MKGFIIPNKLYGEITVPPSKSVAHRAIICAALSKGKSIIRNIQLSKDIIATIDGMKALGAEFIIHDNELFINGVKSQNNNKDIVIDC